MQMRPGLCFVICGLLRAQQVLAPTPERVGPQRGETSGNINFTDSFETGYRWNVVGGDDGKYRSDVNYGTGIRLLGGTMTLESLNGHGTLFDHIHFDTSGLGGDPYESAVLYVEKNRLYRYDMNWRLEDYFNPGLIVSAGEHMMNTSRYLQNHDLWLFPNHGIRFRLGYSRNSQSGPSLSSAQEFDGTGIAFPLFRMAQTRWNEYRLGMDAELKGLKFSFLQRSDFYRNPASFSNLGIVTSGNLPEIATTVSQFQRTEPQTGFSPGWLGNLSYVRKHWGINAHMSYDRGANTTLFNQAALGYRGYAPISQQIVAAADARRPIVDGSLSVSASPTKRLTVVNNTSTNDERIVGNAAITQVASGFNLGTSAFFRSLAILTIANAIDTDYRLTRWISFHSGYHYSKRRIDTTEDVNFFQRDNQMHSGVAGMRLRPTKPVTFNLEGEVGRDNNPFTPVSLANYHAMSGRADYRVKGLQATIAYKQLHNFNGATLFIPLSSHTRNYSANISWAHRRWFSVDAGYAKVHLDSTTSLAYLAGAAVPSLQRGESDYISNLHTGNFGARLGVTGRVDLFLGYNISRDAGDGRGTAALGTITPAQMLFSGVQVFPLTYESPSARLSVLLSSKIRWNAGWQYYNYSQDFRLYSANQNYHSHTGYVSMLWSF